eukprot:364224-Chlamydomonas_euryale.AAC.2
MLGAIHEDGEKRGGATRVWHASSRQQRGANGLSDQHRSIYIYKKLQKGQEPACDLQAHKKSRSVKLGLLQHFQTFKPNQASPDGSTPDLGQPRVAAPCPRVNELNSSAFIGEGLGAPHVGATRNAKACVHKAEEVLQFPHAGSKSVHPGIMSK